MLRQKNKLVQFTVYVFDVFITLASFFLAYWLRDNPIFGAYERLFPVTDYLFLLLIIIPAWSILFIYFKLYEPFRIRPFWLDILKIVKVVSFGMLFLVVMVFFLKLDYISRLFLIIFGLINFTLLSLVKLTIRLSAASFRRKGYNYRMVLIVGTGAGASEVSKIISENEHWGFKITGFLENGDSTQTTVIDKNKVIGKAENILSIVTERVVDEVIFAVSAISLEKYEKLFLQLEEQGIKTRLAFNFLPHVNATAHFENFHGVPLLTFSTTPQDALPLAIKRLFDITISSLVLTLTAPISLLSTILIRLTSPGPLLFKQTRIGLNGRKFTLYKFRSMVENAEESQKNLAGLNEMDGPVFKMKNDPRVTQIGRLLRKFSIDELPQLINVIKGEMSIVGPRPPIPSEVKKYDRWQRRRLSMKPGLTCLWQVNGRSHTSFKEWIELDLNYIDNWSLALDMKILLKTIPVILFSKGAY